MPARRSSMRHAMRFLACGFLLAGCQRHPAASLTTTRLAIARLETPALAVQVWGPPELAAADGRIVATGGGNIVAVGGGHFIGNDGASLAGGTPHLAAVAGASLRLLSLDGAPLAAPVRTDAAGRAELQRPGLDA